MIEMVRARSEAEASRLLPEIFRFRHRIFIDYAGWKIPARQGMEFDQFDTPQAQYLLCRDARRQIRGIVRLIPTTARYMIRELWSELLDGEAPPVSNQIWEISRFGIDPALERAASLGVQSELALGCLLFGLRSAIEAYWAVMPPLLARRTIAQRGWSFERCGPLTRLGDYRVAAIQLPVSPRALAEVRRRAGRHADCQLRDPAVPPPGAAGLPPGTAALGPGDWSAAAPLGA